MAERLKNKTSTRCRGQKITDKTTTTHVLGEVVALAVQIIPARKRERERERVSEGGGAKSEGDASNKDTGHFWAECRGKLSRSEVESQLLLQITPPCFVLFFLSPLIQFLALKVKQSQQFQLHAKAAAETFISRTKLQFKGSFL